MERLLTAEQVREYLSYTNVETIYRMAADGRLPVVRLSDKAYRFRESDVEAYVASRLTRAADG